MDDSISVYVVDDNDLMCRGVRRLFELETDIKVVGEAANANDAISQIRLLSPDVVLMDIRMPGGSGIHALRQLEGDTFPSKVVILTAFVQYLPEAIEAGAAGYLLKGVKADELLSTIRTVNEGNFVFGSAVMDTPEGNMTALGYLSGQPAIYVQ